MELHIPVFVARAVLPPSCLAVGNTALRAAQPSRRGKGLFPESELLWGCGKVQFSDL